MTNKLLSITEVGMIIYWGLAFALILGFVEIPPEYMYSDHKNPLIIAWNWSFFPIDIIFSVLGLLGRFGKFNTAIRYTLSTISLSLMFCAGIMAISFWVINQDYDPFWWLINIWLIILPTVVLISRLRYS